MVSEIEGKETGRFEKERRSGGFLSFFKGCTEGSQGHGLAISLVLVSVSFKKRKSET